jgi:hypothetical protein
MGGKAIPIEENWVHRHLQFGMIPEIYRKQQI